MIIENKINDIIDYKIRLNRNIYLVRQIKCCLLFSVLFFIGATVKLVELLKLYEKNDILDQKVIN